MVFPSNIASDLSPADSTYNSQASLIASKMQESTPMYKINKIGKV